MTVHEFADKLYDVLHASIKENTHKTIKVSIKPKIKFAISRIAGDMIKSGVTPELYLKYATIFYTGPDLDKSFFGFIFTTVWDNKEFDEFRNKTADENDDSPYDDAYSIKIFITYLT